MEDAIQEMLDQKACEEVIARYGRTLDWLDEEGQAACFWPDAQIDYGFFKGSGEEWLPVVMAAEMGSQRRWHISTGVLVSVQGQRAKAESYGIAMGVVQDEQGGEISTLFGGRYLDELEKREGEWRISKRTYIADWAQQFTDGLQATRDSGMALNVLDILAPDHPAYRRL